MAEYEIDFGEITERRDARTGDRLGVTVEVHVRRVVDEAVVADYPSDSFAVEFDVTDGTATFERLSGDRFDDLALAAIDAAAEKLAEVEEYTVEHPLRAVAEAETTELEEF